jgi:hypothetical protein
MKAVGFYGYGGADKILIRVAAAGVNPAGAAQHYSETGRVRGKLVLVVDEHLAAEMPQRRTA